ncbi:cell division cycle-associated protein 7-like isoform X2 [Boleophthalmus pectinirostris]|uniref:cell division cycle-associated protein 7-like isoform X2 n=1 Tax=Boleophthalmus pectinirostris TaxID=150288 RepID=UPI00242C2D69|nr:cell division cycle-associated protein 7-like isoform X2 [Boleophthalmus pectinirostris]
MAVFYGMHSLTKELADIFAEDSDNDKTFYGFSEGELNDKEYKTLDWENKGKWSDNDPTKQEGTCKPTQPFKLRVALRLTRLNPQSSDEETENVPAKTVSKKTPETQKEKHVTFEEMEKTVVQFSPLKSEAYHEAESFLAKREQNIKANKAMLAQLMADLQTMPGGAGFLKKQAGKQAKKKSPHPPCSGGDLRKNPERASRRCTRSMGGNNEPKNTQEEEEELELTLEDELLEVRRPPQGRGTPRPYQTKPHVIRPIEDITEEELELVADSMTEKVYNKVSGSTCHQCRQKTIDTKTCCRNEGCRGIQGQFCGPCLRNRYGEDVKKALLNPEWNCPPCRGICNCSFCRQREGRCPTGILFPLAQYHGFSDVHSYLTRCD